MKKDLDEAESDSTYEDSESDSREDFALPQYEISQDNSDSMRSELSICKEQE